MKYTYSKTSKQRKEEQKKQEEKKQKKLRKLEKKRAKLSGRQEGSVEGEQVAKKESAFTRFMAVKRNRIIALVLASVMGLALIITPIVVLNLPPKFDTNLPVAKITLDNRMELYFELDYINAPIAVNNFIFLAQEGFFKNALIFDAQSGFSKFGGYQSFGNVVTHRAALGLTDKHTPDNLNSKFSYSIRDDSTALTSRLTEWGVLSTIKYNSGSTMSARTEFQMCGNPTAIDSKVYSGVDFKDVTVTGIPFGYAVFDKTLSNLEALTKLEMRATGEVSQLWRPIYPEIRVKNVKIYTSHLETNKWGKDWNFFEAMKGNFTNFTYTTSTYTKIS